MRPRDLTPKKVALLARILEKEGGDRNQLPLGPLRRDDGPLPLSFAQEQQWTIHRLDPDSAAYNVHVALPLEAGIDPASVESGLNHIGHRHEILRTIYPARDGRPEAVIRETFTLDLDRVDLTHLADADRDAAFRRVSLDAAQTPFDLTTGPVLRARLVQVGGPQQVLMLTLHHIVTDGWSMGVLFRELRELIDAAQTDRPPSLPPLPIQYADFATWQRARLTDTVLGDLCAYWREELAGITPLDLPADRRRPASPSYAGGAVSASVSPDLAEALRRLGRDTGATLFTVLVSGFTALLRLCSGDSDIVVGVPVANRDRLEVQGLIGYFVNMVPLRARIDGGWTVSDLLATVHAAAANAFAHQEIPFDKLVAELGLERDASRNPVFETVFSLLQDQRATAASAATVPDGMSGAVQTTRFDLEGHVLDMGEGLRVNFVYSTDLFDQTTAQRLIDLYVRTLSAMASTPEMRLDDLVLLDAREREQTVTEWNQARPAYPRETSLAALFAEQVAARPLAVALEAGPDHLTYEELNRRANRVAHGLRAAGVALDQPVGVLLPRGVDLVVALVAVLKAGGAYVALNPEEPPSRLAMLLSEAGATLIVTDGPVDPELAAGRATLDIGAPGVEDSADILADVSGDGLAYIAFTSGSTGRPKGVAVVQRAVARLVLGADYVSLGPSETLLQLAPVSFDASTLEIWGALLTGGRLVVYTERVVDPQELGVVLRQSRVTTLWLTSSLYNTVIDQAPDALVGVRQLLVGGEALSVAHIRRGLAQLPTTTIVNGYGPTENTTFTCCHRIPKTLSDDVVSIPIGSPIPHTQVYVLDARGEPAPIGVAGELHAGGDGLARGYVGAARQTAQRFVPDGVSGASGARLYRTGDIVRWKPDRTLEFFGRRDSQVKLRGFRIELGEIESALTALPGVAAAVADVWATDDGKRLAAFVVPASEAEPDVGELRAALQRVLPGYMVPGAIAILPALPLNHNGKIDRRALPDPFDRVRAPRDAATAPSTETEALLAGIWAAVLRLPTVGVEENFFELGGDSILSLQIVARAREAGLRCKPKHLFQYPTVAALAKLVADAADETDKIRSLPSSPDVPAPLTPIQRWFLEGGSEDVHHFNQAMMVRPRAGTDPRLVHQALEWLVDRHDMLRARFRQTAQGWQQEVAAWHADDATLLTHREVPPAPADSEASLTALLAEIQGSLDIERGPVFRAVWIELGQDLGARLLLIAHHLVVDGVSWRILLADFERAYDQLSRGESPETDDRPTRFCDWAGALASLVDRMSADEVAYWLNDAATAASLDTPCVPDEACLLSSGAVRVGAALDPAATTALLRDVGPVFGTQITDLLLAGVASAFARESAATTLRVDVERHGRSESVEGLDLSRTVGWFTTMYPVTIDLAGTASAETLVERVSETLGQVPRDGVGYGLLRYLGPEDVSGRLAAAGVAPVSFNYLGQFDQLSGEASVFPLATESVGPLEGARIRRAHLIDVVAYVVGGELRVEWSFDPACHARDAMERLSSGFITALTEIVSAAHARAGLVAGSGASYPLTPMQQGMLFHTLMHPGDGVYSELFTCRLEGPLHVDRFRAAWSVLIGRHDALRTEFVWEGVAEPVQVVRPHVDVHWTVVDWSDLETSEQEVRLRALEDEEARQEFDLARGPLIRLALARLGPNEAQFVWGFHHILLDGWSMAILFRELGEAYDALAAGRDVALAPAAQYGSYVRWLRRQRLHDAREYWRTALQGVTQATPLGVDTPASTLGVPATPNTGDLIVRLSEARTSMLVTAARRSQVTVNALLLGAWAFVLSRYSRQREVVFGMTVSGRPATLPDAESTVGLFINTVPVRLRVPDQQSVASWLQQVQTDQAVQREHEHLPLVEIAKASRVPQGMPLFESILVYENYPVEQATSAGRHALTARQAAARHRSSFPLVLAASPGRQLALQVIHDANRVSERAAVEILVHLERVLTQMAENPQRPVGRLAILTSGERRRLVEASDGSAAQSEAARTLAPVLTAHGVCAKNPVGGGLVAHVLDRGFELLPYGVTGHLYVDVAGLEFGEVGDVRTAASRLVPDPFGSTPGGRLYDCRALAARLSSGALELRSDRSALADRGPAPEAERPQGPPVTEIERRIAAIWQEVLGVASASRRDHFFEEGGHSLLATKVISRLRAAFGLNLPLALLFEHPVLQDLARAIAGLSREADGAATAPTAGRRVSAPLSPAQQRLWFLDQLDPGVAAYNVPAAVELVGYLDARALDRAFTDIVGRHDVLRTTFAVEDGEPVQRIGEAVPFRFDRVDLESVPRLDARRAEAQRLANQEALAPFDLAAGPLIRGQLVRLGDREHILLVTMHHIVCDAWSLGILVSELMALYSAHLAGRRPVLPELTHQYADFSVWQRAWLDEPSSERQLAYWTEQLAGCPTLDLSTDRPRPVVQTFDGGCHTRLLPGTLGSAVERIAREEQATLFMTTLAAFQLLLSRYSGMRDVVVGTPVAVRPRPEFDPLIGFFSNTLALRTRIVRRATFRECVRQVRATVLEGFQHQDVPFERVVERVQPDRHLDRHPIFQVLFTMQHAPVEPLRLPGLELRPIGTDQMKVRFDLEVHVAETAEGLLTAFYYSEDLFDRETVAQMADAFAVLIEHCVTTPDASVESLGVVPAATARQLREWNDTVRAMPGGPVVVHELVEAQVRRTPDAVAVDFHNAQLTYAQLNARANQVAHALRARGIGPDDCVAIGVERGPLLPVAVLGAMKAGGAYMPLDASYPAARLRFMLEDCGAKVLVTESSMLNRWIGEIPADAVESGTGPAVLCLDREADAVGRQPTSNPANVNDPDHLAFVLYTSGSTGRPKGVAMPHRPLLNLLGWQLEVSGPRAAGRTLQYAPLSFDPSFLEMFSAWSAGGTLVLIEEDLRRDFLALARLIDLEGIERLFITPAALHQLADAAESAGALCQSLREVNAAGERLEVTPQISRLLGGIDGAVLYNQYGPTETHVVTVETLPAPADQWPTLPTIGVALPNTRIRLLDASGLEVPIGVPGEMYIGGVSLARGYLDNPRLTAERFLPDPGADDLGGRLYRTGDLARFRRNGLIEYLGRTDQQVKLRGYRVELGEVEAVLTQHQDVLDAAATVWQAPGGSHQLVAYVVSRGGATVVDDLRTHAARLLPEYMVPSLVEIIDALPLTPSGKVDRQALPSPSVTTVAGAAYVGPRNEVEVTLAAIWCDCLGVDLIGVHDNFFAAGGHSLLAAQVASRVRREWGVDLPIRAIFESPTVAGVSECLQTLIWTRQPQSTGSLGAGSDREEGQL